MTSATTSVAPGRERAMPGAAGDAVSAKSRAAAALGRPPHVAARVVAGVWKWFVAAAMCTSAVLSILVVGWVMRLMQRGALRTWYRRSAMPREGMSFAEFVAGDPATVEHRHWPNHFVTQNLGATLAGDPAIERPSHPMRRVLALLLSSLWRNASRGLAGIACLWVLTLPATTLWAFSWYAGWDNSFNKGYEQAYVGPSLGLLGTLVFCLVMMYVPLAHARHASNGSWRSFFDFAIVRAVMRRRRWACVGLAALFAALALPIFVMKVAPLGFGESPAWAALDDAAYLEALRSYYFACCLVVVPLYLLAMTLASRIYAGGLLEAVNAGDVPPDALTDIERGVLVRLDLLDITPRSTRPLVLRAARGFGATAMSAAAFAATFVFWFTFVAQIYVAEFLNSQTPAGWLNQPLVQLPWFNHIPPHLLGG